MQLRYVVLALQRRGNRRLGALFQGIGLTTAQAETLEILAYHGPLTTREVGGYLLCESGSPSRILAALAEKKLSMRSHPAEDKRITLHSITKAGRDKLNSIYETEDIFHQALRTQAEEKNISEKDLSTTINTLTALLTDPELKNALHLRFSYLTE